VSQFIRAVAIICLLLFAHCKNPTPQLTFAVGGAPSEVDYWERIIHEFTDSTGISVLFLRQPTDTDQRRQGLIIPLKAQESDPDLFLMDVVWVAQLAASGWLMPLTKNVENDDLNLSVFFESIISNVDTYNDEIIALPVYNDCGLLYYRKDLLAKHDLSPPVTWLELIGSSKLIQERERRDNPRFYGFVWQGAQYEGLICTYLEFVASHGGTMLDAQGNVSLTNAENIAAVNMMRAMIHEHKISPPNTYTEMKEEEVRLFFENGDALYERNWPYAWALHTREESPIRDNVGVTILPKSAMGHHASTLGGWHAGISRFSDRKEQALALLRFIVSYDVQKRLALDLGWNPGRRDIYEDSEIKRSIPHIQVLKDAFDKAVARPSLPYYTQVSAIMQKYINAIIAGRTSTETALTKAQEDIKIVAQQYHE
jgi:multiple sugar transport system substrate-binding protein